MSSGDATQIVVPIVVIVVVAVAFVLIRRGRRTPVTVERPPVALPALPRPHVAVVANPTKIENLAATAVRFAQACAAADLDPPAWHRTTIEDPGHGQTRAALARGASAVLAYGGDGTVRAVAAELAGSSVPLGVIPAGTGNLLARNLALPLTDVDEALDVALGATQRRVDVARLEIDVSGEDDEPRQATFCVMAGIGFDAEVMASVAPELKQRVGWWAYILAGARRIAGNRTRVTIRLDDEQVLHRQVRSVIIGNCGELTGGFRLMPSAAVDDGWLDIAVVAPRGVVGWGAVVATVLTHSRRGHPVVQYLRCRRVEIRAERPLHVQVDGDPAGTARVLRAGVLPGALIVRCP